MELNDIRLTPQLLVEFFRNSLVELDESPVGQYRSDNDRDSARLAADTGQWHSLGDFAKNILLIVRYEGITDLSDQQMNFLRSILAACKLSLKDVAILNIANLAQGHYKSVRDRFKSSVTILFGVTPREFEMPLDFPAFQVQAFDGCRFLHAGTLESLEKDKVLKSKLWVSLRRIFDLP